MHILDVDCRIASVSSYGTAADACLKTSLMFTKFAVIQALIELIEDFSTVLIAFF